MYKLNPFRFTYENFGENNTPREIFSLHPISIESNGLYLLTGESGAGKSTFLNLLKGISPHFIPGKLEGDIFFNREKITEENFQKLNREIVYLFQNPFSQIINSNVELEFAFTLENLNADEKLFIQRKNEIEKIFELDKLWNKKTHDLSNGECQKLVLASLIAIAPKVILLDEPTAFLDPEARAGFYKIINEIKKNHIVVMVDHHIEEVRSIADHFFWVNRNGEINQVEKLNVLTSINQSGLNPFEANNDSIELEVKNLNFSYKDKSIIKNLNLNAKNGDVIVIRGKNGQGKSTIFKLLTKILKPNQGTVEYLKNKVKIRKVENDVGFIFQNPESSFFHHTLKEELSGGKREFISQFFSSEELNRSPYLFSEGQKRRISILINVVLNKKILFFDEPTFGQDKQNITKISDLINYGKKAGFIQFIISHDEEFIKKVATKSFTLKEGELFED